MKYLLLLLSFSFLSVQAHGPFSQFGSRDWSQRVNKYRNSHRSYPEYRPKPEIKPTSQENSLKAKKDSVENSPEAENNLGDLKQDN